MSMSIESLRSRSACGGLEKIARAGGAVVAAFSRCLMFAVPGLATLSAPSPALAQWYVGVDGGPTFQNAAHVSAGTGNRTEYQMGARMQAQVGYDFGAPKAEFELGYGQNLLDRMGKPGTAAGGVLDTTTAMVNGVWDFLPGSSWHPFVGVGIGGAYIQAEDITHNDNRAYGGFDVRFAYQGFAGIGYDITSEWEAKLQYKYLGTTDYTVTAHSGGSGSAEYGNQALLAGMTYRFSAPAKPSAEASADPMPVRPYRQSEDGAVMPVNEALAGKGPGEQMAELSADGRTDVTASDTGPAVAAAGAPPEAAPEGEGKDAAETPKEPEDWSFHAQYTLTEQVSLGFRSPAYNGSNGNNSLNNKFQSRETQSVTPFLAVRLGPSTELYVDPEVFEGFGLSGSLGMGDLTNGEAQKVGSMQPKVYLARYYLKQVIGLGGPQEWQEGAPHQLAGWQDVSRLTVIAGGFAVTDFMGGNSYAQAPRHDFDNWGILQAAAWDWAADGRAYTGGVFVEYNQEDWALRWAGVLQPKTPGGTVVYYHGDNADNIDHNVELETRYKLGDRPGKTRLLGFLNQGNMGRYSRINSLAGKGVDIGKATSLSRSDWGKTKVGYVVNLEQEVADELGVFARWSWNDGTTEEWNYTDADHSLSGGISLKGGRWGRPNDTYGLGMVVSGLSGQHQQFLANGGQGMMLGEGSLPKYQQEMALESYYAWKLFDPLTLTADYQFIDNPGYNPTRGPVHVFGARLHAEY